MAPKNGIDLPELPGVYLFKEKDAILYIGKASNLKKRVSHYFQGRDHLIADNLLQRADDLEFIVTATESEALQLEYNLIHTYQPPLNVRLKDDKRFPWIEITLGEPWPGIYFSRRERAKPGSWFAGPIVNAGKARNLLETVTRVFRLRSCGENRFRRGMVCLYYHIGRCSAPCEGKITPERYGENVRGAVELLKGKKEGVLRELRAKMTRHAENLEFEAAQVVKEDLELLRRFSVESAIITAGSAEYDALALHKPEGGEECFAVLISVSEGRASRREFFRFQTLSADSHEGFHEFVLSWYPRRSIPPLIAVSFAPSGQEDLEAMLGSWAGRKVEIRVPQKGDKRDMVDLAVRNLQLFIRKSDYGAVGGALQSKARLTRFPHRIEVYDISHFAGRERVGARVVFCGGRPERRLYRNYIIRDSGPGDTDALYEVLSRRFRRDPEIPDLLLIDGGAPQLGVGLAVKREFGLKVDVAALAKEEERLYLEDGSSLLFPVDAPERLLLQNARDEAHRRAVSFHRKRRGRLSPR